MLALLAVAAIASGHPAKMFVSTSRGIAITDYPSLGRCQTAKAALTESWKRAQEAEMPGYKIVQYAPFTVICFPG